MGNQSYQAIADQMAAKYGLDAGIFKRQIGAESGWNPNARSPAGALGIAQFMPLTAKGMGVNPMDPVSALDGAARYMRNSLKQFGGDYRLALAAYNAGGGAARKALVSYPETKAYVAKIMGGGKVQGGSVPQQASGVAPVQASGAPQYDAVIADIFADSGPEIASALATSNPVAVAQSQSSQSPQSPQGGVGVGRFKVLPRLPGEPGWKYLQRLGSAGGLRNDAGDSQTTGGGHAAGSDHYKGTAIDFGDAKNAPSHLDEWVNFLNKNKQTLGVKQTIWRDKGHYNHAHASLLRNNRSQGSGVRV